MPEKLREPAANDTRARLLDAAIARLADSGPAVNFDAIAGDVGLTKGALYHHFGSVEGLIAEVYRESVRRHAELVVAASSEGTGRQRLLGLVEESAALYGSRTPFYRLLLRLQVEAGVTRPNLAPIVKRVQRRQRVYMADLVRAGQEDGSIRTDVDAAALGEAVDATLQGLLVHQLESPADQRKAAANFAALLEVLL